eukprot:CAMPEP_0197926028 /NCGR_PEP_ID=MMETSP1439-20131203/98471_1 /TAXON_ID=66791 /ORGANISM="Gonyaulax spinifera, Strain CCMP409" /LENGTH=536 /DNA_ID=CAMNT_0043548545 /DNA_START=44 /DNA_END=1654 /DNA_ORIENTATION=+
MASSMGFDTVMRSSSSSVRPLVNHAATYEFVGNHKVGLRRRAFPELKAVRNDKMKQVARTISDAEKKSLGPIHGPAMQHHISNGKILKKMLMDPVNLLAIFGPLGVLASMYEYSGAIVFCLCFLGLVPLAKLLGDATEHLAENLNETTGGLLNATFGNAVEMIITISAIKAGLLEIVKKSLLGSILSNLLLVLGMSFFAGGISRFEQEFSGGAALINVTMLLVGILSFSMPTIFSFGAPPGATLHISRTCAIFVAIGYLAYLVFQLYTHTEFFEDSKGDGEGTEEDTVEFTDTEGERIMFKLTEAGKVNFFTNSRLKVGELTRLDASGRTILLDGTSGGDWGSSRNTTVPAGQEDLVRRVLALWQKGSHEEPAVLSVPWALGLLLLSTIIVAFLSEYMVDAIDGLVTDWGVPQAFVGVILLPIVGNACEHLSAVRMAYHNKVATAIAIAIGSSTQIAIFVMPFAVITARILGQPLDLDLHPTGLAVLFISVLVVFSIVLDGKSNWLEGFMLALSYCLVAVLYWYTPDTPEAVPGAA